MAHPPESDTEPALTDELRALLHPRTKGLLLALVLIVVLLGVLGLVASRTVLSQLWR